MGGFRDPWGFAAYRMATGSKSADLYSWQDNGSGPDCVQNAPISSQFPLQWKLRVATQEAMLKEMANGKLRRTLDHDKTTLQLVTPRFSTSRLDAEAARNGGARRASWIWMRLGRRPSSAILRPQRYGHDA